jgi:hypothetical protein
LRCDDRERITERTCRLASSPYKTSVLDAIKQMETLREITEREGAC